MHERASHTPREGGRTHLERAVAPPLTVRAGGRVSRCPAPLHTCWEKVLGNHHLVRPVRGRDLLSPDKNQLGSFKS